MDVRLQEGCDHAHQIEGHVMDWPGDDDRRGACEARATWFMTHAPGIARRICFKPDACDDLVADTYLSFERAVGNQREKGQPVRDPWALVRTIMEHRLQRTNERATRLAAPALATAEPAGSLCAPTAQTPKAADIYRSYGRDVTTRRFEAVRLRTDEGMSIPDIGRAMGITTNTAREHVRAARDDLRRAALPPSPVQLGGFGLDFLPLGQHPALDRALQDEWLRVAGKYQAGTSAAKATLRSFVDGERPEAGTPSLVWAFMARVALGALTNFGGEPWRIGPHCVPAHLPASKGSRLRRWHICLVGSLCVTIPQHQRPEVFDSCPHHVPDAVAAGALVLATHAFQHHLGLAV